MSAREPAQRLLLDPELGPALADEIAEARAYDATALEARVLAASGAGPAASRGAGWALAGGAVVLLGAAVLWWSLGDPLAGGPETASRDEAPRIELAAADPVVSPSPKPRARAEGRAGGEPGSAPSEQADDGLAEARGPEATAPVEVEPTAPAGVEGEPAAPAEIEPAPRRRRARAKAAASSIEGRRAAVPKAIPEAAPPKPGPAARPPEPEVAAEAAEEAPPEPRDDAKGPREEPQERAAPLAEGDARATAVDDLAADLEDYDRGRAAFDAGDFDLAARRLRGYLDRHPTGRLRLEARLDLVEALIRLDRPAEALPLAEALLADPSAGDRRAELRRIVVDLRVATGDCLGARRLASKGPAELLESVQKCEDGGG